MDFSQDNVVNRFYKFTTLVHKQAFNRCEYLKPKNHMKVHSTSSFTVKPGQTFLGRIKFELAMLSSLLVLISHSPVEESIIQKKSLIQELNSDWINKASIFKVAEMSICVRCIKNY